MKAALLRLILIGLLISFPAVQNKTDADIPAPIPQSVIVSLLPINGATKICVDTPLRLSFNLPVIPGTGQIKVIDTANGSVVHAIDAGSKTAMQSIGDVPHYNYLPLIFSGRDATVYLPNGSLAYNKTYYITIDAGAFKTAAGIYPGISGSNDWRFTTKPASTAKAGSKIEIAADGSGDFCTVQAALDSLPAGNNKRTTLFLHKGTYTELINFHKKGTISLVGEDRRQTVIAYANNARFNPSSERGYHRGVLMAADCPDLVVTNLTIRNTTPRGGSQAETLILNGRANSRAIISSVDLYSFQDTLQINGQAYIRDCYIEGDVDFMWGRGPCFFENCHCFGTRTGGFYAQIRNPAANHGFVFNHCIFDGPEGITGMYINRVAPAIYPHSEMVLIDCQLGSAVSPAGWLLDAAGHGSTMPTSAPMIHFWEYNSHDPVGKSIDMSHRIPASRQLQMPADASLLANYRSPAFVLGNTWDPLSDPNLPAKMQGN